MLKMNFSMPESPTIMVIPSWYPPRGGEFFREHSLALAQAGLKVHVLAAIETGMRHDPKTYFSPRRSAVIKFPYGAIEHRQVYRRIPLLDKINALNWVNSIMDRYSAIENTYGKPDLIQAHSSMWAGLAAARISQKRGIPFVITEHRGRFTGRGTPAGELIKAWHIPLLAEAFDQASRVICVSNALKKEIIAISPESAKKLSVIPNMTDTAFFHPKEGVTRPHSSFRFLCVAHLENAKGVDLLIKAFASLNSNDAGAPELVVAGDGKQRRELHKLCKRLPAGHKVFFKGALPRSGVLHELQQADALVLPSRFESFGIVLIEAMACGLPVVATNAGGPADILTHDTGILCPPDSIDALANAMQQMISRYSDFDTHNIRQHCIARYSKEAISSNYINLYNKLLKGTA